MVGTAPVLNCHPVGGASVIDVPLKSAFTFSWIRMFPIVTYAGAEPPTAFDAQILVPPNAGETVTAANVPETLKSITNRRTNIDFAKFLPELLRDVFIRFSIVDLIFI
jgi:hypothetical protein